MTEPELVRNDDAESWGLYYPGRDVIEAAVGSDVHEVPGEYLGLNWHRADGEDLRESIEDDIAAVRADIEDVRGRDLTDEQERELRRLELKLESHEKVFEIARQVSNKEDWRKAMSDSNTSGRYQSAEVVTHEDYDRWVVEPEPPDDMKQPRFCFECSSWHAYDERPEYDGYPTYHTHTECPTCGSREPCGLPPAEEFDDD